MSRSDEIASTLVQVQDQLYAVPCADVVSVVPLPTLHPIPGAPRSLLGTFSYGARVVPVVDLARAFGDGSIGNRLSSRVVLVRAGEELVGALVSRVVDVRRIPRPSRAIPVARNAVVADATLVDGRPVHFLELAQAFPQELRALLSAT